MRVISMALETRRYRRFHPRIRTKTFSAEVQFQKKRSHQHDNSAIQFPSSLASCEKTCGKYLTVDQCAVVQHLYGGGGGVSCSVLCLVCAYVNRTVPQKKALLWLTNACVAVFFCPVSAVVQLHCMSGASCKTGCISITERTYHYCMRRSYAD